MKIKNWKSLNKWRSKKLNNIKLTTKKHCNMTDLVQVFPYVENVKLIPVVFYTQHVQTIIRNNIQNPSKRSRILISCYH